MVAQPAEHHIFTWGAGEVVLEVLLNLTVRPTGEGTDARADAGELGDGGEGHADGRGQMPHQVLEKLLARAAGGSLDNGTEDIEVVMVRVRRRCISTGGSWAFPVGVQKVRLDDGCFLVHQRSF